AQNRTGSRPSNRVAPFGRIRNEELCHLRWCQYREHSPSEWLAASKPLPRLSGPDRSAAMVAMTWHHSYDIVSFNQREGLSCCTCPEGYSEPPLACWGRGLSLVRRPFRKPRRNESTSCRAMSRDMCAANLRPRANFKRLRTAAGPLGAIWR